MVASPSSELRIPALASLPLLVLIIVGMMADSATAIHPDCINYVNVRTFDGYCNNLDHPTWGQAVTPVRRVAPARYVDGVSVPYGGPNERTLSQTFFAEAPHPSDLDLTLEEVMTGRRPDPRGLNMLAVLTLQAVTHDMGFVPLVFDQSKPLDNFAIAIENCTSLASNALDELCIFPDPTDPNRLSFPQTLIFTRPSVGTFVDGVFTPISNVSAPIDLSIIYGSDAPTADVLRSHVDGKLIAGSNGIELPTIAELGLANDCQPFRDNLHASGDTRVDENMGITVVHILMTHFHNYLCDMLKATTGMTDDEQLFSRARELNIAVWQHIIYDHLIPAVFGPLSHGILGHYHGYDPSVDPRVQLESSAAAFRFHSMLNMPLLFLSANGTRIPGDIETAANRPVKTFETSACAPDRFDEVGSEAVLRGLLVQVAQELNGPVTDTLRNLRLGAPGNVDVAAAHVFRGRVDGLSTWETIRVAYGMRSFYDYGECKKTVAASQDSVACFAQITDGNVTRAQQLQGHYRKLSNVDPFVGFTLEGHLPAGSVGRSASRVVLKAFSDARDSDRFFYRVGRLSNDDVRMVERIDFAQIISVVYPQLADSVARADGADVFFATGCRH